MAESGPAVHNAVTGPGNRIGAVHTIGSGKNYLGGAMTIGFPGPLKY